MIPVGANPADLVVDYRRHQSACIKAIQRAGKANALVQVLHLMVSYDLKTPVAR